MAVTLPLEKLEKDVENIYEAIIMIAKRARQINEMQKQVLQREIDAIDQNEDFDDEGISKDYIERQYFKLPNPTTIALQEMMEGQLKKEYPEKEG